MQESAFQKLAGNTTALLSHLATGSLLLTSKMLSDVNLCDPNLATHLPSQTNRQARGSAAPVGHLGRHSTTSRGCQCTLFRTQWTILSATSRAAQRQPTLRHQPSRFSAPTADEGQIGVPTRAQIGWRGRRHIYVILGGSLICRLASLLARIE